MAEQSKLFLVRPGERPQSMMPSAPANEDELQKLIADYPELIADGDGDLLLIEREHGISDALDGAARWSLDHLFVTRAAVPVLVEVKRAVDTRLRREVVGQLLDYAANGVAYWPKGAVAARFEETCSELGVDSESELAKFLNEKMSPDAFWEQVDTNFRAGRIKLVFVADEIPNELARIVEFLNDQMTADVRAVELRYFEGEDGVRTLMPRIIGETERSRIQKHGSRLSLKPIGKEEWINQHITPLDEAVRNGAAALLEMMESYGGEVDVASTQGSIYLKLEAASGKFVYPLFLLKKGTAQIGFGWVAQASALVSDEARRAFFQRFEKAIGPLSSSNIKGYPSFPLERLSDPTRLAAFREVLGDFIVAGRT